MRMIAISLAIALAGCGGSEAVDMYVTKSLNIAHNNLPYPFMVNNSIQGFATNAPLQFVVGPVEGVEVNPVPAVIVSNTCKPDASGFVVGPCIPIEPKINYCTDGFVIGPCTPLPKPVCQNGFVIGPCK